MAGPLVGVRVLDLTRNVAGPYATKLLADYGADVLKLEPPDGDPSRAFGPFADANRDSEASGLFLHLNTNKRSATVDVSSAEGAVRVRRLAAEADILIEDFGPGEAERLGWGWETLSAEHPGLAMVSITPFGQDGPYRDFKGSDLTLQAIGGPMNVTGHIDKEPLKLAGHFAHYHAGIAAALAATLVRLRVEAGGAGDWVDLSVYECQAGSRDRRTINLTAAAYTGYASKRAGTSIFMGAGVRSAQDGHVNLFGAANRLPALLKLISREDLADNEDLYKPIAFVPRELVEQVEGSLAAYLAQTPKLEALAAAQALGILGGAILTTEDLLTAPHYRDRGAWDSIDHPRTGPIEYPGRPFIMSASPRPQPRRAPLLGEHDAALEGDAWAPRAHGRRGIVTARASEGLPLEGVRVADVTVVWAGPHVTQLLGEWGADVIRVEPVNRIQPYSRGAESVISKEQAIEMAKQGRILGAYPDLDPKGDRWNRSAAFNAHARNKRSMACDIMSPEGKDAFLRLIERCDVFVENNVPETIEKAGITWDVLREVNPRLIMLRMPAFGLDGPYKNYRAFGTHAEGMVGHHYLRGYTDAGPEYSGDALTADAVAGVHGALAVAMALRHRDHTGEGQQIELPLAESFIPILGEFIMDYTMNGRVALPQGNTHPYHAPHNVYATSGDDQWIAVDVGTDEEFKALCEVLGAGELLSDERFGAPESRHEHRDALDERIAVLTASRDKEQLFRELQAAGVCSAPMHNAVEALADEHLNARQWFRSIEMPTVGTHRYPGYLFRMRNTEADVRMPPPLLGQHSEQIYLELLGYSREEYDALAEQGLVGDRYPDAILPTQ